MSYSTQIDVPIQGPTILGAATYFKKTASAHRQGWGEERESKLLKSLRLILKGPSSVESDGYYSTTYVTKRDPIVEQQLTWDSYNVILSEGGVIRKRWSFHKDGQPVQWACIGRLEQPPKVRIPPSGPAHFAAAASNTGPEDQHNQPKRPIFGPFHRIRSRGKEVVEPPAIVSGVYIFFRGMGRIFLENGLEYSFPLPFVTRRAWPVFPYGVLIQRNVDRTEQAEAQAGGGPILPTIFSLVNPRNEATPVGVASGIIGGLYQRPLSLTDEEQYFKKPQTAINSKEIIVGVPPRLAYESPDDIIVTYCPEERRITIWRYAYLKPNDSPVPLGGKKSGKDKEQTREKHVPGVPSPLASATTMADIMAAVELQKNAAEPKNKAAAEENKPEITIKPHPSLRPEHEAPEKKLDRQPIQEPNIDFDLIPPMHGRGSTPYWVEKLYTEDISSTNELSWSKISVCVFDQRYDGRSDRSLLAICIPDIQEVLIFTLTKEGDQKIVAQYHSKIAGISIASVCATRQPVWDLLVVKPDNELSLLTYGLLELPLRLLGVADVGKREINPLLWLRNESFEAAHRKVVSLRDSVSSSVELLFDDGLTTRLNLQLYPWDPLVKLCFEILAITLPNQQAFTLHSLFLDNWAAGLFSHKDGEEFDCFIDALFALVGFDFTMWDAEGPPADVNPDWFRLLKSPIHQDFRDDPAVRKLRAPDWHNRQMGIVRVKGTHVLLAPILNAFHYLAEDLRLDPHFYPSLMRLVPIICCIAQVVRPEWADHWRRLCPAAPEIKVECENPAACLDDRIPIWPVDITVILYGRINRPDWTQKSFDSFDLAATFGVSPGYAFGRRDPLLRIRQMDMLYMSLADNQTPDSRKRAENAVSLLVRSQTGHNYADFMTLGISSPIQEAARSCQLSPPSDWPGYAYKIIGRNDLTEQHSGVQEPLAKGDYRSPRDYLDPDHPLRTIHEIGRKAMNASKGEAHAVSGVELPLEEFTDVRFGQDRRLDEVKRMLNSSAVPSVKIPERPEMSEHDIAKEQQQWIVRTAERTTAQPYGRALFTYAADTKGSYFVPKLEYSIRVHPQNTVVSPETNKVPGDWCQCADFNNGVAAALRIAPTATNVDSSWIAFHRPSSPLHEHGGFLLGLGLNGHLNNMLTWDIFSYLTPKQEPMSVGLLLGLCASQAGTASPSVTKLLSLHVPALLLAQTDDVNVTLPIQTAGVIGMGLLYMGTTDRHMADICLKLIGTKEKGTNNLVSEHREGFTIACGMAFGMIMLGRGSTIAADMKYHDVLQTYIHGDRGGSQDGPAQLPQLDINLTSSAATIALGLMYLRTGKRAIADTIQIPDTVLALNHIQPSFLMIRTIARTLIMWDQIQPTPEWLYNQLPDIVQKGMNNKRLGMVVDDAIELAYYNIVGGCCFVLGLKFAGTARHRVNQFITAYYDLFSRWLHANSAIYEFRIKRSAIRDSLNLIAVSLGMVMAGSGDLNCLRRLRLQFANSPQTPLRYGQNSAIYQAIGLLFLGGGRYTLGTSDSAIAAMIMAFFPRYPALPNDTKCYLQALRYMWVLAAEPRCLIARDVDTRQVIYLPIKIKINEPEDEIDAAGPGLAQMIAPTLIPDLDKIVSLRVDTPRYWPLNMELTRPKGDRYYESLLRTQTLYAKRRTSFLSYMEDPKGSRSLFVRSISVASDAATLDFPKLTDLDVHPSSNFSQFISSYSNNVFFQAFADHFCREEGETLEEKLLYRYCHAVLLDAILSDKPRTMQSHLTLYHYRTMSPTSRFFSLRLQDLAFITNFYGKIYERRFSGKSENNHRPPILRENTSLGALYALDKKLEPIRTDPNFLHILSRYARGEDVWMTVDTETRQKLAWYLLRNSVPVSTALALLRGCARSAHDVHLGRTEPEGTNNVDLLDHGIKEVLLAAGSQLSHSYGTAWSGRSLDEVVRVWQDR